MQDRLKQIVSGLGVPEKAVVETNFLDKLTLWARIVDEVEAGLPYINDIYNVASNFQQAKSQLEQIFAGISVLNVSSDASQIPQIKSYYDNFSQYFNQLIELKLKIQAITEDNTDITALRKATSDAKKQAAEIEKQTADFEKSFKENLDKQASGSQRVLATHFKKRLKELKTSDDTNPAKWLEKRNWWFITLLSTIVTFVVVFLFIFNAGWFKGYELQLALMKLAIVTILYLQYHFAAKNYHIYADLVAKYEHLAVISETMTDFTAAGFENEELNTVVYTNAAKTLFGEVNTGHLKQMGQEPSVIENFINQIPKGGQ